MKTIQEKLGSLAGDRDITPWLKSLGFSTGVISHVMGGAQPSTDLLTALVRSERVNLSWLLLDKGSPYLVEAVLSDTQAVLAVETYIHNADYGVTLAYSDNNQFAVILHKLDSHHHKDKPIEFHDVNVLAGNIGLETAHWFANQKRSNLALKLTAEAMRHLQEGHIGNMELFGFEDARKQAKGLMDTLKPTPFTQSYFQDKKGKSGENHPVDRRETVKARQLADQFLELDDQDQSHIEAVIGAFSLKRGQVSQSE